ncbi:hypothetical protein CMI41_00080 [Candidatus Pacearchaeota archaeon]|nr:hypothetical protein [Candidatus Pacearchaeota archaeon]|tara:strand:+ start:287 stop:583 length:297 start_codon:yes stop_codon:yes gene_type:complete
MKITKNEMIEKENNQTKRYPNLNTVLMVEDFLEEHRDVPISLRDLEKELPRKVMRQTLQVILEYLWKSGKIIFGPRGIQWIYVEPEHLKKMLSGSLEI